MSLKKQNIVESKESNSAMALSHVVGTRLSDSDFRKLSIKAQRDQRSISDCARLILHENLSNVDLVNVDEENKKANE